MHGVRSATVGLIFLASVPAHGQVNDGGRTISREQFERQFKENERRAIEQSRQPQPTPAPENKSQRPDLCQINPSLPQCAKTAR